MTGKPGGTIIARKATPPQDIPRIIDHPTLDDHLCVITRAIFQAGLSWAIIAARWNTFETAFDGFNVARVAQYDDLDIDRLMATDGIIHSAAKIRGTIANARALQDIVREFHDVHGYVMSFAGYDRLFADARKRFAFLGDLSCYYWLFRTGERVPPFEHWMERQQRDHPRMREMVMLSRGTGRSAEQTQH